MEPGSLTSLKATELSLACCSGASCPPNAFHPGVSKPFSNMPLIKAFSAPCQVGEDHFPYFTEGETKTDVRSVPEVETSPHSNYSIMRSPRHFHSGLAALSDGVEASWLWTCFEQCSRIALSWCLLGCCRFQAMLGDVVAWIPPSFVSHKSQGTTCCWSLCC